ncbi:hypothetical protein EIP86_011596 [Pleurotus ostreatoroseus]|nr:hypothetical protein EIP86_011596 [Pleurotus ostreatoroseus]
MDDWASRIWDKQWFNDEIISRNLQAFCTDHCDKRCAALAAVINRLVELSRGVLPDVAEPPPIDDFCAFNNHGIYSRSPLTGLQLGNFGLQNDPPLIMLRASQVKSHQSASENRGGWTQSILCWELDTTRNMDHIWKETIQAREAAPPPERARVAEKSRNLDETPARSPTPSIDDLVNDYTARYAASIALDTLSDSIGSRLFCVNVGMQGDMINLWYYDASGCIFTHEGISLLKDFEKAAALLIGIANCTPEHLGALPSTAVCPPASAPYPEHWPPRNLKGHTITLKHVSEDRTATIQLRNGMSTKYMVEGTRSAVYSVEANEDVTDSPMVAKLSYQLCDQRHEEAMVLVARKAGIEHIPEIHLAGDLWTMSDGVRQIFFEQGGVAYDNRTLRAVVYTRYQHLDTLFWEHPEHIPEMASQMLDCLHDLKEKADILHRDISDSNVMYELRDGKPYFVLGDYDFATFASSGEDDLTEKKRMGRRGGGGGIFAAVDLIKDLPAYEQNHSKVTHSLRHDYEGVFWLSLYCAAVFPKPEGDRETATINRNRALLEQWRSGHYYEVYLDKMLIRSEWYSRIALISKAKFLEPWLDRWAALWQEAERVRTGAYREWFLAHWKEPEFRRTPPTFDKETVNGLLTRDAIKAALASEDPPLLHGDYYDHRARVYLSDASDSEEESYRPSPPPAEEEQQKPLLPTPAQTASRKRKAPHTPVEEQTEYRRNRPKRSNAGQRKEPEPAPAAIKGSKKNPRNAKAAAGSSGAQNAALKKNGKTRGNAIAADSAGRKRSSKSTKAAGAATRRTGVAGTSTRTVDKANSERAAVSAGGRLEELGGNDIRRRLRPRK